MDFKEFLNEDELDEAASKARDLTKAKVASYRKKMQKHIDALSGVITEYKRAVIDMAHDNSGNRSVYRDNYYSSLDYNFHDYFVKNGFQLNLDRLEKDIKNKSLPHQKKK